MTPDLAVAAGFGYLRATASAGRWRAFSLPAGRDSDGWVTGYVGASLAEARVAGSTRLVADALDAVLAWQRPDGRFGWGERTAADADSTIWALRLAAAHAATTGTGTGRLVPPAAAVADRVSAAERALVGHVRGDGGVACFLPTDQPVPWLLRSSPRRPFAGWCAVHPCITAAAAAVPATAAPAARYLVAAQQPDGSWPAYWWVDREYPVAHAAEALAATASRAAAAAALRAGAWACRRLGADGVVRTAAFPHGSPFATALAVRAVLAASTTPHAHSPDHGHPGDGQVMAERMAAAVGWLCRSIRLDGSWQPSALLRVPHPHDTDPDRPGGTPWRTAGTLVGAVVADATSTFTTATVVSALARAAGTHTVR